MNPDKAGLSPEAVLTILALLVLYPALGWLGFTTASRVGFDVAFWCASGAWIATLLSTPRQRWRAIIATGIVASVVLMALLRAPLLPAAAFVLSDAFAVYLTARYMVRQKFRQPGSSRLLMLILIAAGIHTLLLSPAGGGLAAALEHNTRYASAWLEWFSTSLSGAVITVPFLYSQLRPPAAPASSADPRRRWLGLALLLGMIASSLVIARTGGTRWGWEASLGWITYGPLVCAVCLSLVWPVAGSVTATATLAALELTILFYGERIGTGDVFSTDQTVQLRWYLSAAALLSSLTAAVAAELRLRLAQIEEWKARYESALSVAKLLQYEVKLPSRNISWTGDTVAHFGVPAAAVATVDLWSARIHPSDHARFGEFLQRIADGDESPPDLRVRALLAGGRYAPVSIKVSSVTTFEGAIDSVRGTVQLAAGRKRGKLKLYRREPAEGEAGPNRKIRPAVLMIHGIGGSEHDFGPLYKVLGSHGFDPQPLTLPGHRGHPEDLLQVRAEQWIAAAEKHHEALCARYPVVHVMGISLGALIAIEVARRARAPSGRLILISSPVFIDGWGVPWFYALRFPLYRSTLACNLIKVEEEDPFGVKDDRIRAIVAEKFARSESYHYSYVPLGCVREIDRLRAWLLEGRPPPDWRSLIIHSREDDLTSTRSAEWLRRYLGPDRSEVVWLNNSYHMVCIDNDRGLVAQSVLKFLQGAEQTSPGARAHFRQTSTAQGAP